METRKEKIQSVSKTVTEDCLRILEILVITIQVILRMFSSLYDPLGLFSEGQTIQSSEASLWMGLAIEGRQSGQMERVIY